VIARAVARRVPHRSGVRRPVPGRGPRAGTAPSTLLRSRRSRATARRGAQPRTGVSWRPLHSLLSL